MDSLTIVLPSNANPDIFPHNTASAFSTQFVNPIELSGKCEVALTEISYVNEVETLKDNFIDVFNNKLLSPDAFTDNKSTKKWMFKPVAIDPIDYEESKGGYQIDDVELMFKRISPLATIGVSQSSSSEQPRSFIEVMNQESLLLVISESMAKMLGFSKKNAHGVEETQTVFHSGTTHSRTTVQLKRKVSDWNIYFIPIHRMIQQKVILKNKAVLGWTQESLAKEWKDRVGSKFLSLSYDGKKYPYGKLTKVTKMAHPKSAVIELNEALRRVFQLPSRFLVNAGEHQLLKPHLDSNVQEAEEWSMIIYGAALVKTITYPKKDELLKSVQFKSEKMDTIKDLVVKLNESSTSSSYRFTYNEETKRLRLVVAAERQVVMDPVLTTVLGFQKSNWTTGSYEGSAKPVLDRAINYLYIYCNIADYVHVGGVESPLLRAMPFHQGKRSLISKEFINPNFVPLNRILINRIDIEIRDEAGELVPFHDAKTIITLRLRRAQIE